MATGRSYIPRELREGAYYTMQIGREVPHERVGYELADSLISSCLGSLEAAGLPITCDFSLASGSEVEMFSISLITPKDPTPRGLKKFLPKNLSWEARHPDWKQIHPKYVLYHSEEGFEYHQILSGWRTSDILWWIWRYKLVNMKKATIARKRDIAAYEARWGPIDPEDLEWVFARRQRWGQDLEGVDIGPYRNTFDD